MHLPRPQAETHPLMIYFSKTWNSDSESLLGQISMKYLTLSKGPEVCLFDQIFVIEYLSINVQTIAFSPLHVFWSFESKKRVISFSFKGKILDLDNNL